MKADDFRCPRAEQLVRSVQGHLAFVPAPLPPELTYDADLALALSRADAALGALSGLGRHLPNPHLLIAPYMRREAVLSSRIEGTRISLADLFQDEVAEAAPTAADHEAREVRNYVAALEHGIQRLAAGFPLSLYLVRELHRILLTNVRGQEKRPGEFREEQNYSGEPRSTIETATYVPRRRSGSMRPSKTGRDSSRCVGPCLTLFSAPSCTSSSRRSTHSWMATAGSAAY